MYIRGFLFSYSHSCTDLVIGHSNFVIVSLFEISSFVIINKVP